MHRRRIGTMKRFAIMLAGLALSGAALADPLPLSINVGNTPNDRTGDGLRTAFTKTMTAVNTLNALRGKASGIATLTGDGRLPYAQVPAQLLTDLAGKAAVDASNIVQARGLNARSTGLGLIPYKPEWANTPGPERLRYQNLMELVTSRDGDAWESPLALEFRSKTGYNRSWQAGASVAAGENIVGYTGNPEPYVYRVLQGGALGSTSPTEGPNTAPFANGTAQLQWINYSNLAAKISFTNTVVASENAGQTWANNFNFIMNPLSGAPRFMTNTEFDFKNSSGYDCDLFSGRTCNSITMFTGGPNRSTSIISMGALAGTTTFASEWGLSMVGPKLIRDAAIELNVSSKVGIGIGRYAGTIGGAIFSESSIQDQSTSVEGLSLQGAYSNAAINVSGNAPISLAMKAGQKLCFFGGENCFVKDNSQGKLLYQVGGVTMFSVADDGTLRARGAVIQNTTP